MIEQVVIKNFRAFEDFRIEGLRKINLISGENASGKTALLEALIFANRALPNTLLQMQGTRGEPAVNGSSRGFPFPGAPVIANVDQFHNQWDDFFYEGDHTKQISIRCSDSQSGEFGVDLRLDQSSREGNVIEANMLFSPFVLERFKNGNLERSINISVNQAGQLLHTVVSNIVGRPTAYFASNNIPAEFDNVGWYSLLSKSNREREVLEIVQRHFPFIESLSVLSPTFQPEAVYGGIGKHKRPIATISSGLHKFISILLGSLNFPDGVVIVDEIENGIWHEKYGSMWKMIHEIATAHSVQFFISSHSLECMRALAPIVKGNEGDFCQIRMKRDNDRISSRNIAGKALQAALRGNVEIR